MHAARRLRKLHPDWPLERIAAIALVAQREAPVPATPPGRKPGMAKPRGTATWDRARSKTGPAAFNRPGRGKLVKGTTAEPTSSVDLAESEIEAIGERAMLELARSTVELSAKTAGYSVTPAPTGKPGGPGLWGHKGWHLPPYIQNVTRGIMRSGKSKSQAIEIAIGRIKGWAFGGGNVSPEVRVASQKAITEWVALRAKAKITPGSGRGKR